MNRYEEDDIDALGSLIGLVFRLLIGVIAIGMLITCMEWTWKYQRKHWTFGMRKSKEERTALTCWHILTRPTQIILNQKSMGWRMKMIKRMLLLALCFGTAQAETIAFVSNKGGGRIVITDDTNKTCPSNTRVAYTTTETNRTQTGCWTLDSLYIHILWSDGELRSYPLEAWEFTKPSKTGRNL